MNFAPRDIGKSFSKRVEASGDWLFHEPRRLLVGFTLKKVDVPIKLINVGLKRPCSM
jgi:hypothetical protein